MPSPPQRKRMQDSPTSARVARRMRTIVHRAERSSQRLEELNLRLSDVSRVSSRYTNRPKCHREESHLDRHLRRVVSYLLNDDGRYRHEELNLDLLLRRQVPCPLDDGGRYPDPDSTLPCRAIGEAQAPAGPVPRPRRGTGTATGNSGLGGQRDLLFHHRGVTPPRNRTWRGWLRRPTWHPHRGASEAPLGIEPSRCGFADRRLPTWPRCHRIFAIEQGTEELNPADRRVWSPTRFP